MKDAELDCMRDAMYEQAWAELNKEDPKAHLAATQCGKAAKAVAEAERLLLQAAEAVENTPEEDRLISLANSLEDLECAINKQTERMK